LAGADKEDPKTRGFQAKIRRPRNLYAFSPTMQASKLGGMKERKDDDKGHPEAGQIDGTKTLTRPSNKLMI
jgi:hypothetical protein